MKWISYRFPCIYEASLKLLHRENLRKRYEYIARNIKEKSNVLDIGCGTGILGTLVSKKCNYVGIDLNDKFLQCAAKRNLNVFKCDIFDFKKHSKNVDTIVVCDVLHHIYPKHDILLENIAKSGVRRIIVCEPYMSEKDKTSLSEKFNVVSNALLDSDGINVPVFKYDKRWRYSRNELKDFFEKSIKNRKKLTIKQIGKDIIAVYNLN